MGLLKLEKKVKDGCLWLLCVKSYLYSHLCPMNSHLLLIPKFLLLFSKCLPFSQFKLRISSDQLCAGNRAMAFSKR